MQVTQYYDVDQVLSASKNVIFDDLVFVALVFRAMDGDNICALCFPLAGLVWLSIRRPQASRHG